MVLFTQTVSKVKAMCERCAITCALENRIVHLFLLVASCQLLLCVRL